MASLTKIIVLFQMILRCFCSCAVTMSHDYLKRPKAKTDERDTVMSVCCSFTGTEPKRGETLVNIFSFKVALMPFLFVCWLCDAA